MEDKLDDLKDKLTGKMDKIKGKMETKLFGVGEKGLNNAKAVFIVLTGAQAIAPQPPLHRVTASAPI